MLTQVVSGIGVLLLVAALVAMVRYRQKIRLQAGVGAIGVAFCSAGIVPAAERSGTFWVAIVVLVVGGAYWIFSDRS